MKGFPTWKRLLTKTNAGILIIAIAKICALYGLCDPKLADGLSDIGAALAGVGVADKVAKYLELLKLLKEKN